MNWGEIIFIPIRWPKIHDSLGLHCALLIDVTGFITPSITGRGPTCKGFTSLG